MGTIYDAALKKIEQLCEFIDDSILFSLLLIRKLSQGDAPLSLCVSAGDARQSGYRLWNLVAADQERDCVSSIARALSLVEFRFPFVDKLMEQNERQNAGDGHLRQLICLLSDIPEDELPSASIFEHHLRKKVIARQTASALGDCYTPKRIAQCLAAFLDPGQGTAYDPCCGSGALLLAAQSCGGQDLRLYGQTQDEDSYLLSQMNLILHGIWGDLGKTAANTLLDDQHKSAKFDYIITNPPFNSANWFGDGDVLYDDRWRFGVPPRSNANFAWLQHILSHLRPKGRAAVILPNGTLTTQTGGEAGIRAAILQNKQVEAIISLPAGLFYTTKIPFCIWLLTGAGVKSDTVLFVDAARMAPAIKKEVTSVHAGRLKELVDKHRRGELHTCAEWYGVASLEAIEENGFLLSPNLYTAVSRPGAAAVRKGYGELREIIDRLSALPADEALLTSVVSWRDMEAAKSWEKAALLEIYDVFGGVTKGKASFGRGFPVLDVKTVIRCPYMPDSLSSYVEVTEAEQIKYGIKYGDVLLNRTSETIKELACCCVAMKDQDAVYGGFIKRLRPCGKPILDPLYAACYFRSEIYRWEVENVSTVYTTYASVDNRKLSKIAVYFPDMETQRKIGGILFAVFQFQKQCADKLRKELLQELGRLLIQQYITYPILCAQGR